MGQLKIMICGDVCTGRMDAPVDLSYSERVLAPLASRLESVDYRIVNLENPLVPAGVGAAIVKSGPCLKSDPQCVSFLQAGHFDCAILANNHLGDYGPEGVLSTIKTLDDNAIAYIGGGKNKEEAYLPCFFQTEDSPRACFLAVCENEFGCAECGTPGAAGLDLKYLSDCIRREKQENDFIVVIVHGGNEHNPVPSPETADRYRLMLDLGADAVVAMHPHCMQGYELYDGKPIIYSLGNFFFPKEAKSATDPWNYGYMAELCFEKGQKVGFTLHPYYMDGKDGQIVPYEGADKEKVLAYLEKISAPIADRQELEKLFEGWCMIAGKHYAKMLCHKPEYLEPEGCVEDGAAIADMRNDLWCEAHATLLRGVLKLEYEGRIPEALLYKEKIEALKVMPL